MKSIAINVEVVGDMLATSIYIRRYITMMDNQLPWEKPRIKRILELFPNSRVFTIKKISSVREVWKDEIQR